MAGSKGARGGQGGSLTAEQRQKINNIKKSLAKQSGISGLTFTKDSDGNVKYKFTETKTVTREHGGKMISPEKADIYERKTEKSGTIHKDGLIKRNKDVVTDTLIKKGRQPRRRAG